LRAGDGTRFKTGCISGVRTLAGYADTAGHGQARFVIALKGNDGTMRFRLFKAIRAGHWWSGGRSCRSVLHAHKGPKPRLCLQPKWLWY
jgi:hypothetical protein